MTPVTSKIIRHKPRRDWNKCTWLGKQRLYSLSRVLRDLGLKPDYGDADPAVIKWAAHRGLLTELHCYKMLEMESPVTIRLREIFNPKKRESTMQQEVEQRVRSFHLWMRKYNPQLVDFQSFAWSEQDRVCWQRDLRVKIRGQLWLIDIKATSKPEKDWPLQLGCGLSYDEDGCENAAILHLKPGIGPGKQGYRFIDKWSATQLKAWWRIAIDKWKADYMFERMKAECGFDAEAVGLEIEDDFD